MRLPKSCTQIKSSILAIRNHSSTPYGTGPEVQYVTATSESKWVYIDGICVGSMIECALCFDVVSVK